MRRLVFIFGISVVAHAAALALQNSAAASTKEQQKPLSAPGPGGLLSVKRVYVAPLQGGTEAEGLRDLIISSLNSTKLFVLTDNEERADAVLKGAADDHTFTDTFDSDENVNGRTSGGSRSGGSIFSSAGSSITAALSGGGSESHHIKERKHEAYATVRLVNKDGDVLWSTTQESLGAKFRGASADVAGKVARQLTLDVDRVRRAARPEPLPTSASQ